MILTKNQQKMFCFFKPAACFLRSHTLLPMEYCRGENAATLQEVFKLADVVFPAISTRLHARYKCLAKGNRIKIKTEGGASSLDKKNDGYWMNLEKGDVFNSVVDLAHETAHIESPECQLTSEIVPKTAEILTSRQLFEMLRVNLDETESLVINHLMSRCNSTVFQIANGKEIPFEGKGGLNYYFGTLAALTLSDHICAKKFRFEDILGITEGNCVKKLCTLGITPNDILSSVKRYTLIRQVRQSAVRMGL